MLLIKSIALFPLKYDILSLARSEDGNISTDEVLPEPNFAGYFHAALGRTTIQDTLRLSQAKVRPKVLYYIHWYIYKAIKHEFSGPIHRYKNVSVAPRVKRLSISSSAHA